MENRWLDAFIQEAEELLCKIEESALALGGGDASAELINDLFRAFHTIKGSGSMCGLDGVSSFTHHVETFLDEARAGRIAVSPEWSELILASADHIKALIAAEQGGPPVPVGSGSQIISRLQELSGKAQGGAAAPNTGAPAARPCPVQGGERKWKIRFRPSPDLFTCGGNPVLLLRELRTLGACEITAHTEAVPALDEIHPASCYLWWDITLHADCDLNEIRDVFMFVEDGAELRIEAAGQSSAVSNTPAAEEPPAAAVGAAPANATPATPPAANDNLAKAVKPGAPTSRASLGTQSSPVESGRKLAAGTESTVRVPASRLDRLVNLVGELVMNQSRVAQVTSQIGAVELANPVQEMERLVAELRDDVLGIRMLPIGSIFGRFRRLVHDLSKELGKDVSLATEGEETELDKSILDRLGEPLVHLLRNCIDHGIETAEERAAKGKPRTGTIRLAAAHTGTNVVISVEDDGRGISREAVRAKAIEKQLISPDANVADRDLMNLILLPGFSTARQLTNVSGRGVGMDAVKKQIDALRGSLSMTSREGAGTKIFLNLPLTLAIIEGLVVLVGDTQFIIPMSAISENVELLRAQRRSNNGRNVTTVRGELIPYVGLREVFDVPGEAPAVERIVIVQYEEQRVGLVVDRVLGTHQTVLQSLGRFFRKVDVVSGGTIMGDGRVALILDIAAVMRFADRRYGVHKTTALPQPVAS